MNLNILPTNVMLAQSRRWLTTPDIRQEVTAHPVGAALLTEVGKAHKRLAEQSHRRLQLETKLQALTKEVTVLDGKHDSMARAIHGALEAIMHGTQDEALAATCRMLMSVLFPEWLGIVGRSYVYVVGAIEAMLRRVTPQVKEQMEAISMGGETLAAWYERWVEAGQTLGRQVQERDHLLRSTGRGGTSADEVGNLSARRQWINAVQTFALALDLIELSKEARERILSALEASIAAALRGRGPSVPAIPEDGDEGGDEDIDDIGLGAGDDTELDAGDGAAGDGGEDAAPDAGNGTELDAGDGLVAAPVVPPEGGVPGPNPGPNPGIDLEPGAGTPAPGAA